MREEELNALLQTRINKKELSRIKAQIKIKKKRLNELANDLKNSQRSVELSMYYLLLKREIERLVRIVKIVEREENRELENRWIKEGQEDEDTSEYMKRFKEITNRYYNSFPLLNFTHRDVPIEYYVHALAVEECGVIEMGGSLIETKKGSLYFVRKKEILHLLNRGSMEIVKTDSKAIEK